MGQFEQRYSDEEVEAAREKIAAGLLTLRSAAAEIGCAPSTLSVRIKNAQAAAGGVHERVPLSERELSDVGRPEYIMALKRIALGEDASARDRLSALKELLRLEPAGSEQGKLGSVWHVHPDERVYHAYSYDGEGKRIEQRTITCTFSGCGPEQTSSYAWDVNRPLSQLALERDAQGGVLRTYSYGHSRLSQRSGADTFYLHPDSLGSVSALTSQTGIYQQSFAYEPFGFLRSERRNTASPPTSVFRFTGEQLDGSGLYHLRARQYDPNVGRFLTPDPLVPSIREPSVGRYVYVNNRPTLFFDPSGLRWCWKACEAWDAVSAGVEAGLQEAGEFIAEYNLDVVLAFGTVVCVVVTGPGSVACFAVGAAAFSAGLTRSAVESGVFGDRPANWCRFTLSAVPSTALFGSGTAISQLWKSERYVPSAVDRRILGFSTEFIGGGVDVLSGAGAAGLCTPDAGEGLGSQGGK